MGHLSDAQPASTAPLAATDVAVKLPRTCGTCTACCTLMGVATIGKAAGTPCPHAGAGGCGIYEERPKACAGFVCLWIGDRTGRLGPEHRPDRVGIMLTDHPDQSGQRTELAAREVYPGAARSPEAQKLIAFLRTFVPVTVIPRPRVAPTVLTVQGHAVAVA